jgi:uncharacterized membrane protein YedE/YeeE
MRILRLLFPFMLKLTRGFLFRTYQRYVLRDFSLIVPLYVVGGLLFGFGFVFGGYTWWLYATQLHSTAPTGTIMLSALPLIIGFQMLIQGLLIDILQSPKPDPGRREMKN